MLTFYCCYRKHFKRNKAIQLTLYIVIKEFLAQQRVAILNISQSPLFYWFFLQIHLNPSMYKDDKTLTKYVSDSSFVPVPESRKKQYPVVHELAHVFHNEMWNESLAQPERVLRVMNLLLASSGRSIIFIESRTRMSRLTWYLNTQATVRVKNSQNYSWQLALATTVNGLRQCARI
ncbi:hypothetical protein [Lacticaseibacillus sp. N501-2]|uniref:hypothetical protein n=1 Tax=Lacticaseibacillus salsurae TaxID=3367729 RepID=UPI0038B2C4EA